jgi:hypothetical protein
MKNIVRVTGLIALAGAALFAVNAGSALAAPPPPHQVVPHEVTQIDPCVLAGTCDDDQLQPIQPCWLNGTCEPLQPIDPCMFLGNCSSDSGDDEDTTIAPTVTPTDEPTATPTDEPTATPTDQPSVTPTTEPTNTPTTQPTDTPPTVVPPHAGDNGGIVSGVSNGVVWLAGLSLAAMALAWVMFLASRKMQTSR